MDYKKLFKSRKLRQSILNCLEFIPDSLMVRIQYYLNFNRWLNLDNPTRYSEKIQWYKLYYRNPLIKQCSDKYAVRDYVKSKGLDHILNDCYGVYENIDEINFDELPEKYVIKDTMGSGSTGIIFVHDKNDLDVDVAKKIMKQWLAIPAKRKSYGREWGYEGIKHRLIIEKMLLKTPTDDLPDYKFFCFNGKVYCSYFMENYSLNPSNGVLAFFDRGFKHMNVYRKDFKPLEYQPKKPKNYDLMVKYAEILASDFPHVRVDLYNLEGIIIFGELTFYNASGYVKFNPDSFDERMGNQFELPAK